MTTEFVTLINAFEVPPEADEPFIAGWERARDFLAAKDRFTATALHRALRDDAELRFVNVARVESPAAWQQAIADPDFPGGGMPFKAHSSLYGVVREDGTPDGAGGVVLINPFEVPADEDERVLAGWDRARDRLAAQRGYLGTRLPQPRPGRLPLPTSPAGRARWPSRRRCSNPRSSKRPRPCHSPRTRPSTRSYVTDTTRQTNPAAPALAQLAKLSARARPPLLAGAAH